MVLPQGFVQDGGTWFSGTGWSENPEKLEKTFCHLLPSSRKEGSLKSCPIEHFEEPLRHLLFGLLPFGHLPRDTCLSLFALGACAL